MPFGKGLQCSLQVQVHVEICNSQEEKEIWKDDIQIYFLIIQGFG